MTSADDLDIPRDIESYPSINGVSPELLTTVAPSKVPDWPETWMYNASYTFDDHDLTVGINLQFTTDTVGPQQWKVWAKDADVRIGGEDIKRCDSPAEAIACVRDAVERLDATDR